ncbi:MAG: histidinol-phosphate transaminase [Candidatus Nanopelagicales bacterium]
MAFTPPVRADLVGAASYGAPQLHVAARLNVNENPFALPDVVVRAVSDAVAAVAPGLNRYPDREAVALRQALADYLDHESGVRVGVDRVWAANGSNEVMHHLFLAFGGPGRTAVSFDPTYSMYPEYARDTFTQYASFARRPDYTVDVPQARSLIGEHRPSLVLLASPNNPTGTSLPVEDVRSIAQAALDSGAMVIVDEAYAEFRRAGAPSALELLGGLPNLVVTRTMSKAFAMAGARIGYAVAADPRVVEALRVVRLPYHLSAITQAVAVAALAHADVLQEQVELLRSERDGLADWLRQQGFSVAPSDANFILFGQCADRHALWQQLVDDGVLIRETGPAGWLRVSIGTPAENDMFRAALAKATAGA